MHDAGTLIKRSRHVIFDLDGTLLDSMKDFDLAFAEVMARHGVPVDEALEYGNATVNSQTREQITELLGRRGLRLDATQLQAVEDSITIAFGARKSRWFNGALQLVEDLHARNRKLYLSSFSPDRIVAQRLREGDVCHCFRLALGDTALKKRTHHLPRIRRHSGLRPAEFAASAVMIGDRPSDGEVASAAGVPFIGIGGTVPDAELIAAGACQVLPGVAWLIGMLG